MALNMDKANWQTYRLREIGTIITGNTPSTKDPENYSSADYCFIKPSDIPNSGISQISDSEFYISKKAFLQSRRLPVGSVLTTCIGIIGKVGILQRDATCNQQINALIPNKGFDSSFLAYSILSKKATLQELANAPVVPIINKRTFSELRLKIPDLSRQLSIAKELDLLTSLIDKKKAQLRDLDALALSIFYEIFGDPYTNIKNWPTTLLESMVTEDCSISYGIVQPGDGEMEGVPIVRPVDLLGTFVHNDNLKKTTKEISDSYKRTILKGNELLLCVRGTTGIVSLAADDLAGCNVSRGITPLEFNKENSRWFMFYQFKTVAVQNTISELTHGIALKGINMADVRKLKMIQPPYYLQKEFEDKVVAINAQKERIKESIQELNSLLQSKMDGYFSD